MSENTFKVAIIQEIDSQNSSIVKLDGMGTRLYTFPSRQALNSWIEIVGSPSIKSREKISYDGRKVIEERFDSSFQLRYQSFWDLEHVPKDAEKVKAYVNGRVADVYVKVRKTVTVIYTPNPNSELHHRPLKNDIAFAFTKKMGTMNRFTPTEDGSEYDVMPLKGTHLIPDLDMAIRTGDYRYLIQASTGVQKTYLSEYSLNYITTHIRRVTGKNFTPPNTTDNNKYWQSLESFFAKELGIGRNKQ